MLTQIMHGHLLVAIIKFGQQFRMAFNHTAHVSQCRVDTLVAAGERVLDIGKQPRPALTATADRNTSATGFGNHGKRIVRTPNVTVAEHWNI